MRRTNKGVTGCDILCIHAHMYTDSRYLFQCSSIRHTHVCMPWSMFFLFFVLEKQQKTHPGSEKMARPLGSLPGKVRWQYEGDRYVYIYI